MGKRLPANFPFSKALPPAAVAAFRELRDDDKYPDIEPLLTTVGYPRDSVGPRADQLTPAQRAAVELITELDLDTNNNDVDQWMPRKRVDRRSWLGLDPPQPLDRPYTFTLGGVRHTEPGWRALKLLRQAEEDTGEDDLIDAWLETVSVGERLAMWGQVHRHWPEAWGLEPDDFFDPEDGALLSSLGEEGKHWAPAYADQLIALRVAGSTKRKEPGVWPLLALVRAGVPIEPRWDVLLPIVKLTITREILKALPATRRGPALVAGLKQLAHPSWAFRAAVDLLPASPHPDVVSYALTCAELTSGPKPKLLAMLAAAAERHPPLLALVDAARSARPPLVTLTTAVFRDVSKEDDARFSALDEAQILAAGRSYFGKKVPLNKLLALDPHSEESLRGVLTYRALADAKGAHVYDVWEYAGDSGSVFHAGTTKRVASIVQGSVEECREESLTDALELALSQKTQAKKTQAKKRSTAKAIPATKKKSATKKKPRR